MIALINSKQAIELEEKFGATIIIHYPLFCRVERVFLFGMLKASDILIFYQLIQRLIRVIVIQES